jgi:hypothetical protein
MWHANADTNANSDSDTNANSFSVSNTVRNAGGRSCVVPGHV